jgi:hypothetical protein
MRRSREKAASLISTLGRWALGLPLWLLSQACGSSHADGPGPDALAGSGGGGGSASTCAGPQLVADPANNYWFRSTLTLPPVLVKPDSNLKIEWAGLTQDFMDHELNPLTGIDTANVILWKLDEQELATLLNADQLSQRYAEIPVAIDTNHSITSAMLFDFLPPTRERLDEAQMLTYLSVANYPPADHTYTVILAVGDLASGGDARMLQAFKLDPSSTNTTVTLTNDSTGLTYQANLHDLAPTRVPVGTSALGIDWTNLQETALGTEFLPAQITRARIARYDETPAELEANFLDLELDAELAFETAVERGTSITFDRFSTAAGQSFTGIDASGTWVLALFCGICRNPAPWYLTILAPCTN